MKNRILKILTIILSIAFSLFVFVACNDAEDCSHEYGDWVVVKEATCEQYGIQECKCTKCNFKHSTTIMPLGHDFIDATCIAPKTCERCLITEGEASTHLYNKEVVKEEAVKEEATCTKEGIYYKSCACGAVSESDDDIFLVEASGHVNPQTGNGVGKCKNCDYYFPCHNLVYQKITIGGVKGYEVIDYDEDVLPNFYHVEVPKYYQGEDDAEPLPVISIGKYSFAKSSSGKCQISLKSIKLNEGLLNIGDRAFASSDIEEITIPNSVVGDLHYTFMQCLSLKKIVVGNGITEIRGYTFYGIPVCETIILGNSVREIDMRTFIDCASLKTLVLPASLVSIPEDTYLTNQDTGWGVESTLLPGKNINVYFNITREELEERTIPLFPRDKDGNLLDKDGKILYEVECIYKTDANGNIEMKDGKKVIHNFEQYEFSDYGLTVSWAGENAVYCLDEWHYDQNGNPVAN